ncbi:MULTISPECIES: hypothetical protein [Sphingobacteriaceae]|uniref:Uncharacterized protein n=1 Tax=Sphingobacterium sp. (strain 21) TaxID=743722 RepID=F4CAX2_SPHS2
MSSNLENLSKSLRKKIEYSNLFRIPYVRINARWVLTASLESEEDIELNDLSNYTWRKVDGDDLKMLVKKDVDCI